MGKMLKKCRRPATGLGVAVAVTALTVMTGNASAGADEGTILGANSADAIEGSYIVVLKDGLQTQATTESVVQRNGGDVERTYTKALRGYSASMSEQQAKRTAADPAVAYVEQNQVVRATADQNNPPSWGLDRTDQTDLPLDDKYSYSTEADNVDVYVIDTGILTTHTDFGGRASHGYDFVDNDADATDCNGHGTHVAGTIGGADHGLAKGVNLHAVRVLDCGGSGSTAGVVDGVDWVTENASGPSAANMSLGGGASTALDDAVARSIAAGVTYGLAAGNEYGADACAGSPSRVPEGITVGSSTNTDARSEFSNIGTCVDIFAPGSDITSAWIDSDTSTNTISGTSMATPHVVGGAALYLADNPSATPQQVRDALVDNGSKDKLSDVGTGSPNVLLYTGSGSTDPGPDPDPEPGDCSATTADAVAIPDRGDAIESPLTITGCARDASDAATVNVQITHSYIGDLVIDLVAADGTTYRLKDAAWDSTDNLDATYTVDVSGQAADGDWTLRVQDVYSGDAGTLDSWTFTA